METVKIIKDEVVELCEKLVLANDNMYKVGGLDLLSYKEEMIPAGGMKMINDIKDNFDQSVEAMYHKLEERNMSSKDMLDTVKPMLAISEKLIEKHAKLIALANNDVETVVVDPHYSNSETTTTIHTVLNSNGDIVDYVALDRHNNITRVFQKEEQLVLDNSTSYGSIKDNMLYGWCFDRDGYVIPGFESSGYYKER